VQRARLITGRVRVASLRYLGCSTWQSGAQPRDVPSGFGNQQLAVEIQSVDKRTGAVAGSMTALAADHQYVIRGSLPRTAAILLLVFAIAFWGATGSAVIAAKPVPAELSATAAIVLHQIFRVAESRWDGLANTLSIVAGLQWTGGLIGSAALTGSD
jgi:hypothetical protein